MMLPCMATAAARPPAPAQFAPGERFLTVGVVAEFFGVTEVTIKNWVDAGQLLAARTVGGHRRIAASSVVKLLEEQGRPVPPALARRKPVALLIAADAAAVKLLKRGLSQRLRVEVESDPYLGLLSVARLRPEVAIVDLQLPHGDPKRLIAALREDPQTRPTDVLALGTTAADAKAIAAMSPASPPPRGQGSLSFLRRNEVATIVESAVKSAERPHPIARPRRR